MAEQQRGFVIATAAAAAAGVCALSSSLGFALGGPQTTRQPALRGVAQQQPSTTGFDSLLLGLAGAGSLAAAASVSRGTRRTAVKSSLKESYGPLQGYDYGSREDITKTRKEFALGMYGSDAHGWGRYEFDPLCLSDRYPEHLPWFREAELKHGRVAMLAYVGLIVPDFFRLPIGQLEDPDIDFVNAHNKLIGPGLGEGPMWWLLISAGILESIRFKQLGLGFEKLTVENAGDTGIQLFKPTSAEGWEQMKMKELKNGRLAMLAVSGAMTGGVLWDQHHFPFTPP